jgi:hypothetical protein
VVEPFAEGKDAAKGKDTADIEQMMKSRGFKQTGCSGDSIDWEKGSVCVTTSKSTDEWWYFMDGWDDGGRAGKGAAQLASVLSRKSAKDALPLPVKVTK